MKIILIIYLIVSALTFILPYLAAQSANLEVHKDFPNLKYKKMPFIEKLRLSLELLFLPFVLF